jgi:hypothetical protein
MRIFALVLVALGSYLAAGAGYDEYHGITTKPAGPWGGRSASHYNSAYLNSLHVARDINPPLFQEFMTVHWAYAIFIGASGCVLYARNKPDKRAD